MDDIARTTQKITAQAIQYVRADGFPESRRVYSRWDDGAVTVEFDNDPFRRWLVKDPPDERETGKIPPAVLPGEPT
jgi:hypothetical protein